MTDREIFGHDSRELSIMGRSLTNWVEEWGPLPLHLLWEPMVRKNLQAFKKVFQDHYPGGLIRFAAKACTHPALLAIVGSEGAGADVISPYETRCALEAGIPPGELDVNGNCKETALIEEALAKGMTLVADSVEELSLISEISRRSDRKARVILRVSGYDLDGITSDSIFTAGRWSKFGAPLKEVPPVIDTLTEHGHMDFLGFHTHIGSQITDPGPYLLVLGKLVELGLLLKEKTGRCDIINMGGGFPVSYVSESEWDELRRLLREGYNAALEGDESLIHGWNNIPGGYRPGSDGRLTEGAWSGESYYSSHPKAEMMEAILCGDTEVRGKKVTVKEALRMAGEPALVIEPGRSIVEDAGITLARVSHVRTLPGGHNLVTVEMGVVSHCDALLENTPNRWGFASDHRRKEDEPFWTFIAGNLCFSGDMLARFRQPLQRRPLRGDVLYVRDTGAYTSHFLASNANSFARPARLLVQGDGSVILMKSRDSYGDIFSLQDSPARHPDA